MSTLQIKKAVRQAVWLKVAVTGPSGSGKTYGALGLAKGLSPDGRVLVIDTENESASLYADKFDFETISLAAPFSPQRYLEALALARAEGYQVVVIDSISHEWAHAGGILDQKSARDARGGNGFANWQEMKRIHQQFVDEILQSPLHIVATVRSKMEHVLEEVESNGRKKQEVRKVGLGLIQAPELEYDLSIVFDVDRSTHLAVASKDRTGLFAARSLNMGEAVGKELRAWRESGAALAAPAAERPAPITDPEQYRQEAGAMFRGLEDQQRAAAQGRTFSQEVEDFANEVAKGPEALAGVPPLTPADDASTQAMEPEEFLTMGGISKQDYETLNAALALYPETATPGFREALRLYAHKEGYLLPARGGALTLARLKRDPFTNLIAAIGDDASRKGLVSALMTF